MKAMLAIFCFLAFVSSALADDNLQPTPYYLLKENMTIYAEPRLDSPVLKELEPGTELTQGRFLELKEIDGVIWRWYEITFELGGEQRQGYVWTPLCFANDRLRYGGTRFYHDVHHNEELGTVTVTIYAEHGGQVTSKNVETVSISTHISVLSEPALKNIMLVLKLYASSEACGLPDEEHYFGWTGSELVTLARAVNMGGAGAEMSYSEQIIWPDLGAPSGTIIKLVEAQEMIEVDFEEYIEGKRLYATELYLWDGRQIRSIKQDSGILDWFEKMYRR